MLVAQFVASGLGKSSARSGRVESAWFEAPGLSSSTVLTALVACGVFSCRRGFSSGETDVEGSIWWSSVYQGYRNAEENERGK